MNKTLVDLNKELGFYRSHGTDKQDHDYLGYYDKILGHKKPDIKYIIEVGIGEGGSIMLWSKFFPNYKEIHAFDILKHHPASHALRIWEQLKNTRNIYLHIETNAYNKDTVMSKLGNKKFDFILDDGPHTLESQIEFVKIYQDYLSENGILIIEDIKELSHINVLLSTVSPELRNKCRHIDCRNGKNPGDSIIFILEK